MAALTADALYSRRGQPATSGEFGAGIPAGEKVFRGSLLAWNAAGTLQRIQTSSGVSFAGMSDRTLDNTAGSAALTVPPVTAMKGTWSLTVPSAVYANIGAPVYATDDGTCTLSSGSGANMQIGTLAGIEGGQTYVKLLNS